MRRAARTSILLVLLAAAGWAWPTAAAERTLTLDPQTTEVHFTLDSALHTVHGNLYLQSGEIGFDPATGAARGVLRFDARKAETGNASRDRKMHDTVLESRRFPWIELTVERVEGTLPESGGGELKLIGSCLLHGDRHPMTLGVKIDVRQGRVTATTDFTVPYIAWGLADPSLLILRVDKQVAVSVVAHGALSPPAGSRTAAAPGS